MSAAPCFAATNQWPNNTVMGTVAFNAQPLEGVTITAYNTNTSTVTQVTTTDQYGNYVLLLPAAVSTSGIPMDYHIWAIKPGYAFYPSVGAGASVTRADHTGDFAGDGVTDIPIYFTVIHYQAIPNLQDRGIPGPPLTGANFNAYDGSNPLVSVAPDSDSLRGPAGLPSPFLDSNDGTVTDTRTGLIWLKDAGCLTPATWPGTLAAVNGLAGGTCGLSDGSEAGDWRLPNLDELESLVDASARTPGLHLGIVFSNVSNEVYWSSTTYFGGEEGSPAAWAIRFSDGRYINDGVTNDKATAYNPVWAVRGSGSGGLRLQSTGQYVTFAAGDDGSVQSGVPLTFPRWVDEGDGTVADTVTGLVWLKQADCIHQTWHQASAAVASLASGQCGLSDGSGAGTWRIPTRNEMQSLSDRAENNHADFFSHTYLYPDGSVFQPAIFNNFVAFQYYWTSTPDASDTTKAWTVFSCDFGVYDTLTSDIGYTLAVRSSRGPGPAPGRPGGR
jgi:hypothetical protein